jgi:hypothetical protein
MKYSCDTSIVLSTLIDCGAAYWQPLILDKIKKTKTRGTIVADDLKFEIGDKARTNVWVLSIPGKSKTVRYTLSKAATGEQVVINVNDAGDDSMVYDLVRNAHYIVDTQLDVDGL